MTIFACFATFAAGVLTAVIFIANGSKTSGEFILRDFVVLMWMVVVAFWLIASWPARAHDHNRPELNEWLKSLHSRGGAWCCDGNDTDEIDDWDTKDGRYRVKFRGLWYDVPPEAVVDGPNKSGAPLLWMYKGYMSPTVRCFMPGAMT